MSRHGEHPIRRQTDDMAQSPTRSAGPISGCLTALDGIVFALAIIALLIFFATEL